MLKYYCNVILYSSVAQLAEHSAVNRTVPGSNPGGGADFLLMRNINGA